MSANADLYLFDGEVIDQVVVVLVEAAVQRHTVRVEEQILRKRKKEPLNPNPNRNVEPGPDDSYCYLARGGVAPFPHTVVTAPLQ